MNAGGDDDADHVADDGVDGEGQGMTPQPTTTIGHSLDAPRVNPDWAKLPLFDYSKWKKVRFGDVVRQLKEEVDPQSGEVERYVAGEHMETESVHIRKWGMVGDGYLGPAFIRRFRKGQVLYGSRRTYLKKVAVAEWDGVTANTTFVLEAIKGKLIQDLLPWLMLSERFTKHSIQESKGSTNPYINFPDIAKFELALPPLDQQRRIAEILWAVDGYIAENETVRQSLKALHNSTLNNACAANSEKQRLGDIVSYASDGPFGSKLKTEHYADSGARVIRLQNIDEGFFNDADKAFISLKYFGELKRYEVCGGDVIVAGLGDETHPVGRATLVPESLGPAINKADCFCIRADEDKVLNAFLAYFLNSRPGVEQVTSKAQGTTRMRINVGNIKTVLIPLLPIEKQVQLVNELRNLELAMANASQAIANTCNLRTRFLGALIQNQ